MKRRIYKRPILNLTRAFTLSHSSEYKQRKGGLKLFESITKIFLLSFTKILPLSSENEESCSEL